MRRFDYHALKSSNSRQAIRRNLKRNWHRWML
jgi:hypothetical protein